MSSRASRRLGRRALRSRRFREPAVLVTHADGTRNQFGEFEAGAESRKPIRCVSAPIDGEERQVLPEGLRERKVRTFWLREAVEAVDEGNDAGDRIEYDGGRWRVFEAKDWGGFHEAKAVRTGDA